MMLAGYGSPDDWFYDEGVHIAYFTIQRDLLQGSRMAQGLNASAGRAVYIRPDPDPDGRSRAILMKVSTAADVEVKERLNDAMNQGKGRYMDLMDETFRDVGWLAKDVLADMREADDFYCSRLGQTRVPKLFDGRVVLLGDAGYATPGFGTSLAIIGAYVLAGELLRHPRDVEGALRSYEGIMHPFSRGKQGRAGAMQVFNPQSQWGIDLRNGLFRVVTSLRLDRVAGFMGWASEKLGLGEKKLALLDYKWTSK
jgi:2-polyprenyl-6-methoxyphenol hydroxylase-like FAD-dependent oxidoreductase